MIIVQLRGGLGNQMFQYAFGKSLSHITQSPLSLDLTKLLYRNGDPKALFRNYDLDIFTLKAPFTALSVIEKNIPHKKILSELFLRSSKFIRSIKKRLGLANIFIEEGLEFINIHNVKPASGDIYAIGFWQNESYFKDIEDDLKKDFTFRLSILGESQELLKQIEETDSVCLNVRRTDYITDDKFIGIKFYKKATERILTQKPNAKFFIFSDDIEWCEKHLDFIERATFVSHAHAGVKFGNYLHLMSKCHHFIIPNSTFAWWAAWLGNRPDKIVICPRNWFLGGTLSTIQIIPKEWQTL